MKHVRWLLSTIALVAGFALLWEAASLKAKMETENLVPSRMRDTQLCHGQCIATGWSLMAVGCFGFWLYYRCPACRIQTRKETSSC